MPDTATDLRKFIPGLPAEITRTYLDGLNADQQAALLRTFSKGIANLTEERIGAGYALKAADSEIEQLAAEGKAEFGAATPEELSQMLTQEGERAEQLWGELAKVLDGAGA